MPINKPPPMASRPGMPRNIQQMRSGTAGTTFNNPLSSASAGASRARTAMPVAAPAAVSPNVILRKPSSMMLPTGSVPVASIPVVRAEIVPRTSGGIAPRTSGGIAASDTGANVDYGVPGPELTLPDRPYLPPPETHDLPGQYDLSKYTEPAITNTLITDKPPVSARPTLVRPPSIIDRILKFFGLSRRATMAGEAAGLAAMSRTDAVASLVRRARNGDQNAMAIIAATRDQALNGNKQAEVSVRLMHAYINAHPQDENRDADMGAEHDENHAMAAPVELSHGPLLTNYVVQDMIAHLSDYEREAFYHGMEGGPIAEGLPQRVNAAHGLGRAVGIGRVIQASRMAHVPLGRVNSDIGWELDE